MSCNSVLTMAPLTDNAGESFGNVPSQWSSAGNHEHSGYAPSGFTDSATKLRKQGRAKIMKLKKTVTILFFISTVLLRFPIKKLEGENIALKDECGEVNELKHLNEQLSRRSEQCMEQLSCLKRELNYMVSYCFPNCANLNKTPNGIWLVPYIFLLLETCQSWVQMKMRIKILGCYNLR
ncbi:unnamed protein product [Protopolystoma xenopodis]|uniref:Uncharacterized protein n=1 Tax=Protopolystoma xenopodis TaxID=117903 RepID=A0A3S5BPW5_9PLAT|nr:unnamed protein product [Protopolystoma xenopodis]